VLICRQQKTEDELANPDSPGKWSLKWTADKEGNITVSGVISG